MTVSPQVQAGDRLWAKPFSKSESSTQTDTHPLESNIVTSYEWNEWELRRKALRLVSHSVRTHSPSNTAYPAEPNPLALSFFPKGKPAQ